MEIVAGGYTAVGGWVTYKPLIGYEVEDGPFMRIEWWGIAAPIVAVISNRKLTW